MAADLQLTIDEVALENTTLQHIRDAYRRALRGKVCRVHGRDRSESTCSHSARAANGSRTMHAAMAARRTPGRMRTGRGR